MIKSMGEKCKVSIRNIRREANEELKKLLKSKEISEDEEKSNENIQTITDNHIKVVDEKVSAKEKRNNDDMNPINHVAIIMDGNGSGVLNNM